MRVAALYDIHGNLPALEAVLAEARLDGVDQIVVGGDVFPGPMCAEALAALQSADIPVRFLLGNGDREVLTTANGHEPATVPPYYLPVLRWAAAQLEPAHTTAIAGWPPSIELEIEPLGKVFFCHATPRSDTAIFTRLTPERDLLPAFDGIEAPIVVCGHTHMQFDRRIGTTRVVNAGSVGMPFGAPGAFWLLLCSDVRLRRTDYDRAAAAARIRATSYPGAEEFAARNVLEPPTERDMLRLFAAADLVSAAKAASGSAG
jgi:predicted phosphodiesterase